MKRLSIAGLVVAAGLILLCLVGSPTHASTSTLSGTIVDAQGNPINGRLTMQLPVPAQDTATNTAIANSLVTYKLVNGVIQAGPPLYDVATIQPANLYYAAKVYDSANNLVMTGNYVVTGGTFNLGAATPTTITTSNISYVTPVTTSAANVFTALQTFNAGLTTGSTTGTFGQIAANTPGSATIGSSAIPFASLAIGSLANQTTTQTSLATANRAVAWPDAAGTASLAVVQNCGLTSGATQACAGTAQTKPVFAYGEVTLNTATTQSITSLPFTSSSSYSCTGSDLTTAAGVVSFNTYTATSVTIQESSGVNTDHLRYVCIGF